MSTRLLGDLGGGGGSITYLIEPLLATLSTLGRRSRPPENDDAIESFLLLIV